MPSGTTSHNSLTRPSFPQTTSSKNRIRILYITTSTKIGGAEKMLLELVSRLDTSVFEVMVSTIKNDGGELLSKLQAQGIATHTFNIQSKFEFFKIVKLFILLKRYKPEILQSFLFFDNILTRVIGKIMHVPIILSGQRNVEFFRSKIRNIIDRATLPFATKIVANTLAGKKILIEREKVPLSKIRVIPNGIDLQLIPHPLIIAEKKTHLQIALPSTNLNHITTVIGFLGHLSKQKGVEYLIRAFANLPESLKNNTLLLIGGDGKEKQNLEQLAVQLQLEQKIFFLGHQNKPLECLSLFDIFVLPSLWEGQPNVILEAMALGLPIIATKVGGVTEMISDKEAILIPAAESSILTTKLEEIILNKELQHTLSKAAQKKVTTFSIEEMVKQYTILYQELLATSSASPTSPTEQVPPPPTN